MQRTLEKRRGPPPIEKTFRIEGICRLQLISLLGGERIERNCALTSAALETMNPVPFVGEEPLKGSQKKATKTSAFPLDLLDIIFGEQASEEAVGQILSVLVVVASAPDIHVERIPISTAKVFQRVPRGRLRTVLRRQDDAPMRRREHAGWRLERRPG